MNAPCKDCPRIGCGVYHDICEKYQAYKEAKEKEYALNKQLGQCEADLNSIEHLRSWRSKKLSNKK